MPLIASCVLVVMSAGCSHRATYDAAHLAGTVTIDGQPVQEGKLSFMPIGSTHGPVVGAVIVVGRYDCPRVPLGDSHVQIYALKPTGKTTLVMGAQIPEMQNLVPAKHRGGIDLKVTGDNFNQDFALAAR